MNINTFLNKELILTYIWENITIETFLKFFVFYFIVLWIALVIWVARDIANRTNSIIFQVFAILLVLFLTPFGIFVYFLVRPSKTLADRYYQEIEENLDILGETLLNNFVLCPACGTQVNHQFQNCPHCWFELQKKCHTCQALLFFDWNICPYCGKKQKKHSLLDGMKTIAYKKTHKEDLEKQEKDKKCK